MTNATPAPMPAADFGSTGRRVSRVGLGGEGVLRTLGRGDEAEEVIGEALAQGITYCDSARAYAGSEGYYGRVWKARPEARAGVFQTSKSAERTAAGARRELELTLRNMHTDHLDLWQIHDVRTEEDVTAIEGPGGALEAFLRAREEGKVRHIGVTGHHDPAILTRCVRSWPVDSVLLPVNPVEAALGGFLDSTLPEARSRGIAVVGMKVLGASYYVFREGGVTAEMLIRFALSRGVDLVIVGCSTPDHVRILADAGRSAGPMQEDEAGLLIEAFRPHAQRLAYYRGVL